MQSSLLVSSIAFFSLFFPSVERWLLPNRASFNTSTDHPGLLVHGPEEKFKHCGLFLVFLSCLLSLQIVAPRWGGVSRGLDKTNCEISQSNSIIK